MSRCGHCGHTMPEDKVYMSFCLGNAVKYIWRADLKDDAVEDLKKAAWYIEREIARRTEGTRESP